MRLSSAMARWPCLRNEGCAGSPLAAHAEAEQDAAHHQLASCVREAAESGGDGVAEDAPGKSADAAEAIGEPSEAEAANVDRF